MCLHANVINLKQGVSNWGKNKVSNMHKIKIFYYNFTTPYSLSGTTDFPIILETVCIHNKSYFNFSYLFSLSIFLHAKDMFSSQFSLRQKNNLRKFLSLFFVPASGYFLSLSILQSKDVLVKGMRLDIFSLDLWPPDQTR